MGTRDHRCPKCRMRWHCEGCDDAEVYTLCNICKSETKETVVEDSLDYETDKKYKAEYDCTNCGDAGEKYFWKGVKISENNCPNCGCQTLQLAGPLTPRPNLLRGPRP